MNKIYKKSFLFFAALMMGLFVIVSAQDPELIIDENFQDWPETERSDPDATLEDLNAYCEQTLMLPGPDEFDIYYLTGGSGVVTMIKYQISPDCGTKKYNRDGIEPTEGVTIGFIGLMKVSEETDTIGQMYLPKLSNVTKVWFTYSCTGSNRGIRIYHSLDNGETWENTYGEEILPEGDAQMGQVVEIDGLDLNNVLIKFTSGVDNSDVSQISRLHDLKIWGVPGGPETGMDIHEVADITAKYVQGTGLILNGPVESVRIFDLTGRLVEESGVAGNQILSLDHLSDGVYIITAVDRESRLFNQKFLKH
ncbi:MAG: T9SS type A sorting domain-containing protein [Bacteroidales bacterium]|nr:T9SS type A sorting domain-containing protein [Bacteroidales bacterium]